MIQLDEIHIEEVRGIRKLTLPVDRKTFAIHGPNGSGKSGVVDAIEFCLTGDMTRLSGRGTGALSVKEHGPHVDARDYPDKAFVRLKVFIPALNKTATLTRKVKSPKVVTVEPKEADILAVVEEVSIHPELTLTRRQIARFILTEAATRSKDIQTLLRLEAIDETRSRLKTASNTTARVLKDAEAQRDGASDALRRCLDLETLTAEDVLAVVNKNRAVLGLKALKELDATTSFTEGMAGDKKETAGPDKASATRDVSALSEQIEGGSAEACAALLKQVQILVEKPELLMALQRRSFIEAGLGFADADECPLCDTPWELDALKKHLQEKLEQSRHAEEVERELRSASQAMAGEVTRLRAMLDGVSKLASRLDEKELASAIEQWREDLATFKSHLESIEGVVGLHERLSTGWMRIPDSVSSGLVGLRTRVEALPEVSDADKAQKLLIIAEERLTTLRQRKRDVEKRKRSNERARLVYNAYCDASKAVLEGLYDDVQAEFAESYRTINRDDEGKFTAKLAPSEGRLDLTVDFHERGLFHPGAYHSEGHQDGMGLCLYLALMRQLLGDDFRLAILDDVVMSVDKQHRRELCKLLKDAFPDTQFIITTHDEAWLRQMQAAKLVTRKSAVTFRGWTVEDGPRVNDAKDAWEEIEAELKDERVPEAAAALRRHLEFVFGEIAESLGAKTPHKLDGSFDLGDVLPNAVSRMKEHLKAGIKSAKAWKNAEAQEALEKRLEDFTKCQTRGGDEQWAVNKAVHWNEWAEFSREDFEPVVEAFRDLLECFRCSKCGSWPTAMPRTSAETLKCDCSDISINLAMPS